MAKVGIMDWKIFLLSLINSNRLCPSFCLAPAVTIIKSELAKVAAVRAVFYLMEGKSKLTQDKGIKAFHALSEGYGFIMALRFTNKHGTNAPFVSKSEIDAILTELTAGKNGFYDVDYLNVKLDGLAQKIASKFGFTVEQASLVN